jgi:hypothetical protein
MAIYSLFLKLTGADPVADILQSHGCRNIAVLRTIPSGAHPRGQALLRFIDGNHDPEYVESDYLVWRRISQGVPSHFMTGDLQEP